MLVTREEIQAALWAGDTFVDFDQGVNFAIKQVRDAPGDSAEDSLYVQTVPKRGYRFLAPVETAPGTGRTGHLAVSVDHHLQKALWANIVELRLADNRRRLAADDTGRRAGMRGPCVVVLLLTR